MKCGRDMDRVKSSEDLGESADDPSTFTPLMDDEYARLAPTARAPRAPVGDVASYKEAAAAAAAALQEQQELESATLAQDSGAVPPAPEESEIDRRGVAADFVARKQFCQRCGMGNPYDQRFCKNCGSTLGEAPGGMADQTFSAPPSFTPESAPIETTTLADVSPSSAYSSAGEPPDGRAREGRQPRQRSRSGGGIADWGAREWLGLTIAALVLVAIIWFVFSGYGMLFNSRNKNIRKAGATMEKLQGFMFTVSSNYEVEQGLYPGSGHVLFETPDRSGWEIRRDAPSGTHVQGTIAVGNNTYSSTGGAWQLDDPATSAGDVILMWTKFRNSETLPEENVAGRACLHYKYRMDPTLMKTVLGLAGQDTVSDAIMETWIDKASFQVVRQTVNVAGGQVDGVRTRITLVMDLAETGKTYGIKPPV